VIQAGLAAPRRALGLTGLILGAALLRALLLPLGDLLSTLVFGGCLLAVVWVERTAPTLPSPASGGGEFLSGLSPGIGGGELSEPASRGEDWGRARSLVAGVLVGAVLIAPLAAVSIGGRGLNGFWTWAALAALIATLEEIAIRGVLFKRWSDEAGPVAAIVIGAVVFALIHLPRYGLAAMPLDAAVGLALGGLRALTGRVLPCAVAHTVADWGAWFWA
jgi:membrane protease YdiL (CAAX protease family)